MKLFRISNILLLALATFFGILLFWTSQAVQKKEDQLAEYKKTLRQEQEAIRVLAVEWDYLNRPQRLEKLAKEQLGMQLPSAKELVSALDQIPEPVVPVSTEALFEEGMAQTVALEIVEPVKPIEAPIKKAETVTPSSAEKQNFYQLIQSLDAEGAAQ